jgi:hypothetical protein
MNRTIPALRPLPTGNSQHAIFTDLTFPTRVAASPS